MTHQICELFEQRMTVLRSWARLRVELHGEDRPVFQAQTFESPVEQRGVGLFQLRGQRRPVHDEPVVLRCDLDTAGCELLDRMVAAAVTQMHLDGASAKSEGKQLVTKANAKDRQPEASSSRTTGTAKLVADGSPGPLARNIPLGRNARIEAAEVRAGTTVMRAADTGKTAQDIALSTVVHADDMAVQGLDLAVAALD